MKQYGNNNAMLCNYCILLTIVCMLQTLQVCVVSVTKYSDSQLGYISWKIYSFPYIDIVEHSDEVSNFRELNNPVLYNILTKIKSSCNRHYMCLKCFQNFNPILFFCCMHFMCYFNLTFQPNILRRYFYNKVFLTINTLNFMTV